MNKWIDLKMIILSFSFILLPLSILSFSRFSFGIIFLMIYMLMFLSKKITIKKDLFIVSLFICSIITVLINLNKDIGFYWKREAIFNFFMHTIIIIFIILIAKNLNLNNIKIIIKGLKIACIITFFWSFFQFITYTLNGMDINNVLFSKTGLLKLVKTASAHRDGILCITGLEWHPGQLVPILVLSYCIFKTPIVKIIIAVIALLSLNSTCILSVIMCFALDFCCTFLFIKEIKVSSKKLIGVVGCLLILFIVFIFNQDLLKIVLYKINNIYERIINIVKGNSIDISTYLHARYYSFYPNIVKQSNFLENLFGYGYECSGYPYSKILKQYTEFNTWIVESDIINFLIGRGWIWTIIFYALLIKTGLKGLKISKEYFIFIICLIISGITYNNQFIWVMIFEIVLYVCVKRKINIWDYA